jgi:hypothetical protein
MGPAKLQFPCHLYYLSPGKLSKYALASKRSGCFVDLPPADKAGRAHVAQHLVHSSRQHAWLVFFESTGSSSSSSRGRGGSSSSSADGGWHFTLVQDAAAAGQASWFLPGEHILGMLGVVESAGRSSYVITNQYHCDLVQAVCLALCQVLQMGKLSSMLNDEFVTLEALYVGLCWLNSIAHEVSVRTVPATPPLLVLAE